MNKDIYNRQYEVWLHDIMEPEEKLFVGRKPPREVPFYALKFPEYLINKAPEEITQEQRDERNDEFLKRHGI